MPSNVLLPLPIALRHTPPLSLRSSRPGNKYFRSRYQSAPRRSSCASKNRHHINPSYFPLYRTFATPLQRHSSIIIQPLEVIPRKVVKLSFKYFTRPFRLSATSLSLAALTTAGFKTQPRLSYDLHSLGSPKMSTHSQVLGMFLLPSCLLRCGSSLADVPLSVS